MGTGNSIRFNVSVTQSCLVDIERVISESKLFNGRADFVFSAIRTFYLDCIDRFQNYLYESKKEGETSLEIITLFDDGTRRYGDWCLNRYIERFKGTNVCQIALRPDTIFYAELVKLANYLFSDGSDKEKLVKACRAAIEWYITKIDTCVLNASKLENNLKEIRASNRSNRINIDT
jgi:hypothetical protein